MEVLSEVCMVLDSLWMNRNSVLWKGNGSVGRVTMDCSRFRKAEWLRVKTMDESFSGHDGSVSVERARWSRLVSGMLKVNTDIAVFKQVKKTAFAAVVCDWNGCVLGYFRDLKDGNFDPSLAELLCIRDAMVWLKEFFHGCVLFESDSLMAVSSLKRSSSDVSYFGCIANDCISLSDSFEYTAFEFVKREGNEVANALARAPLSFSISGGWCCAPPEFLIYPLRRDLLVQ